MEGRKDHGDKVHRILFRTETCCFCPADVNTVSSTALYLFGKVHYNFRQLMFHL